MPRTCTSCTHPHRDEIDRRLLDGAPLRNIAKQCETVRSLLVCASRQESKASELFLALPPAYLRKSPRDGRGRPSHGEGADGAYKSIQVATRKPLLNPLPYPKNPS